MITYEDAFDGVSEVLFGESHRTRCKNSRTRDPIMKPEKQNFKSNEMWNYFVVAKFERHFWREFSELAKILVAKATALAAKIVALVTQ